MAIFVAGIHGVGKTFLAKPAAESLGLRYATASQLIRDERGRVTWSGGKFVDEVAQNQAALIAAASRLRDAGEKLLLDGHFVLRRAVGKYECLPESVFRDLGVSRVLLLECSPTIILSRLSGRGDNSWSEQDIQDFDHAEHQHSSAVCASLGIDHMTLTEPDLATFIAAISRANI